MTTTTAAVTQAVDRAVGPPHKLLYGIGEVIEVTGLGRSKLYELIAAGQIESVKCGKRRLIPAASLVDFVARLRSGEEIG